MENASYTTLTRQSGLMREMSVIASNIANANTTGYRQEGLIFSEVIKGVSDAPSLSMATARARATSLAPGTITQTGGPYDVAIDGDGFFQIQTPGGTRLSRAGHFMPNNQGDLVTPDGYRVLDAGGAPLGIPQGTGKISISADGTLSSKGQLLGQLGIVQPSTGTQILREDGVHFRADGPTEPNFDARVRQGFLEGSNVNPMSQIARMIEVQRAYEMGQSFAETENERLRNAVRTIIK
ncbi:MAG: flagellar hook-basal body complex protein [Planktotalea sp.]|jgi:flagellar basal-body rod protein FlgF|uniref:flagellar hook-basal body complex protein n=1 Tax=Planktotalea sp. TaxID=2029877 RepID=UPI000EBB10A2|nr:flagellar hook-basal body complex protein [Planktotalea sp.]MBT5821680.1 flagellar hook-basal body complex protein [Paracoccaceae bacterium]MDG1077562.1 flagellar hook-basal body complex protein [Planktotalea sp.]MDG1082883.1 flagellar hook-basal body complex protein [Planktotalea sp.]HCW83669.1 flagellar basal-body rod protein FlgF [Paracoccaceae bacterium]